MSTTENSVGQSADTSNALGVTYHNNVVTLKGAAIKRIEWMPGALMVSEGQASGKDPTITQNGDEWAIDVYCGRHKTGAVAQAFNTLNVSDDHMWNPSSSGDRHPDELNFYVGVEIELEINTTSVYIPLYFAQGSNFWGNNWWIASPIFVAKPGHDRIIPLLAPSGQVMQVIAVSSRAANFFEVSLWFERNAVPKDYRTWLASIGDAVSIGKVNLPGTHDSAAINGWTAVSPYVCHYNSLTKQMASGIRLFDIRLKVKKDNSGNYYFMTCHGDTGSSANANEFQSFTSAMDEFRQYLQNQSSEFLVVTLKIDDWGGYKSQEAQVYTALSNVLSGYAAYTLISPNLPTVGSLRKKMFLLNRITSDLQFGAPLVVPNNTNGTQIGPDGNGNRNFTYWIQDRYEDLPISNSTKAKFDIWLDATTKAPTNDMVFNFASATWLKIFKVLIMGYVLKHFGQSASDARSLQLGWSLFDFESTTYQTTPYGALDVIDLLIASNFSWRGYEKPFVVNNPEKDEL